MAKEKKPGLLQEFKAFVSKGNVLDMAVGVIVATAFGKITSTLVNNVFMPFIGYIFGGVDLAALNITLSEAVLNEAGEVVTPAVVVGIGTFLSAVIDFVIIAFIVFMIVKAFNVARDRAEAKKRAEEAAKAEAEAAAAAAVPPAPTTEELLARILEELKSK